MIAEPLKDRAQISRMMFLWQTKHKGTDLIAKDIGVSEATIYNTLAHVKWHATGQWEYPQ